MGHFFRLVYIGFTVLRFGLDGDVMFASRMTSFFRIPTASG